MSVDDKIGGYPVEWFVESPSENFKCGICFDILNNPHQCKNGHTFCHSCISQALKSHSHCPTCNVALTPDSLSFNLLIRSAIDEQLMVKCNHENIQGGCEWTGTLEQANEHFKSCQMCLISCPLYSVHCCMNKNCTGKIKRKDLRDHLFCGGSKRDITDIMLIMAETIDVQKKEIDMLHNLCLNKEAKLVNHSNGCTSFGVVKCDKLEGFCLIKSKCNGVSTSSGSYSGYFAQGKYNGFGVFRAENRGFEYSGNWVSGIRNGHGIQTFPAEESHNSFRTTYIGDFNNNLRHGIGRLVDSEISDFGSFKNGKLNGRVERHTFNGITLIGTCTIDENSLEKLDIYTGTFNNDNDGGVFIGSVKKSGNNVIFQGKHVLKTGIVYEGTFAADHTKKENPINGTGTITYTDGAVYTGEIYAGLRHGNGVFVNKHGFTRTGKWLNNKYVHSVHPQQPEQETEVIDDNSAAQTTVAIGTETATDNQTEGSSETEKSFLSVEKSTFSVFSEFFSSIFA